MPPIENAVYILGINGLAFWRRTSIMWLVATLVNVFFAIVWWPSYSWLATASLIMLAVYCGYETVAGFLT